MKKVIASVGIGNASVDTVLPSETVVPGETVTADVQIAGGDVQQEVGSVRIEIETRYLTEEGYREVDLDRFVVAEDLVIEPDEETVRETTFQVPYHTPVTMGDAEAWVETELDIDLAVDPDDTDYLDVRPTRRLQAVFDAMEELGFSLRTADCEADPYGRYTEGASFFQEFEFRATGGQFRGAVDEVELVASPGPDALDLFVEVDRRGGMLSELAETDERLARTSVASTETAAVREELATLIEQYS
ncbi:sporulation protein [Halobaculum sp. MBLA0143]|uniref:sporulation protein n=1 Tax=Halobaculum sp. MBLA0143 TaxID=3079933 RepID=UPI003524A1C4